MRKVYIAGPMTGLPEFNAWEFEKAERLLRAYRNEPINPLKLEHKKTDTYEQVLKRDLEELENCDAVYLLKGYSLSRGAMRELKRALELGLEIIYQNKNKLYG